MASRHALTSGWSATSSMVTSWLTRAWAVSSGSGGGVAPRSPPAMKPPTRTSGCRPAISPAMVTDRLAGIQPGAHVLQDLLPPLDLGREVVDVEPGQGLVHLGNLVVGDRGPQVVEAVVAVAVGVDDPAVGPAQVGDGGVEGGVAGDEPVLAGLAEHADDRQGQAEADDEVEPRHQGDGRAGDQADDA